jgi:O-methyltransferase involved in polyketide biosynthesis
MAEEKIKIDLSGIPQTLLLPLVGRAQFSKKSYSPIQDDKAIELVNPLDFDFEKLWKTIGHFTGTWWMARAWHFDQAAKAYLNLYPDATIVNLGAGLDTTFYRIDNKKLTWFDIDLPEVILLRNQLLPPPDRVYYLAKSVLDYSWMGSVKQLSDRVFFIAGGLFMYFTEQQMKLLLPEMASRFPQAELIFDSIPTKSIKSSNQMLNEVNMASAILQWGLDEGSTLETWSPQIKLICQMPYFKKIKAYYRFPLMVRARMLFCDLIEKGGIIHLKFT